MADALTYTSEPASIDEAESVTDLERSESETTTKPILDKEADLLRTRILNSLTDQGFRLQDGVLAPPNYKDKRELRHLHQEAVEHNVAKSRKGLESKENHLIRHIAAGNEVIPEEIKPRLVEVRPRSEDELLFRYTRLHWSVPVSAGYGRRIRFVIYDESNGKLIGILGLGDPVFALNPRDSWIGWSLEARKRRLQCVMDMFVLGAVPPYSHLLCGKLVALLATTVEVQRAFERKYGDRISRIGEKKPDSRLALLTTTSALGRSSLYNRLRCQGRHVFQSVGYTRGSGEFHFSNGLYADLREFALKHCNATAKHKSWGSGYRNRRELILKVLSSLDLSRDLLYHGVRREIFVAPMALSAREFLRGEDDSLENSLWNAEEAFAWFRSRWLLPRADRDDRFKSFNPETYRLWSQQ